MIWLKRLALLLGLVPAAAFAQSIPNGTITQGQVWSPAQWNLAWQSKQDVGTACLLSGCTLSGPLTLNGSGTGLAVTNNATMGSVVSANGSASASDVYTRIFPGVTFTDQTQSAVIIPPGFSQQQEAAVGAYFRNQAASSGGAHDGIGLFAAGTCEVNGSACWGIDTILMDSATREVGTGTGRILASELDYNVMNAATQVIGLSIGGNSLAQPTTANGFTVNPLGPEIYWGGAFISEDAAAQTGLSLGLLSASGNNVSSQTVSLSTTNESGTKEEVTLQAQGGSSLVLNGSAGASLALQSGSITIDAGGGLTLPSGYGVMLNGSSGAATAYVDGSDDLSITAPSGHVITLGSPVSAASGQLVAVRRITGSTTASDTATASDYLIAWDTTDAAPKAEDIPACSSGIGGQTYVVKDEEGNAATYAIIVTPASGTIDGAASVAVSTNHGSVRLTCDGATNWMVN